MCWEMPRSFWVSREGRTRGRSLSLGSTGLWFGSSGGRRELQKCRIEADQEQDVLMGCREEGRWWGCEKVPCLSLPFPSPLTKPRPPYQALLPSSSTVFLAS